MKRIVALARRRAPNPSNAWQRPGWRVAGACASFASPPGRQGPGDRRPTCWNSDGSPPATSPIVGLSVLPPLAPASCSCSDLAPARPATSPAEKAARASKAGPTPTDRARAANATKPGPHGVLGRAPHRAPRRRRRDLARHHDPRDRCNVGAGARRGASHVRHGARAERADGPCARANDHGRPRRRRPELRAMASTPRSRSRFARGALCHRAMGRHGDRRRAVCRAHHGQLPGLRRRSAQRRSTERRTNNDNLDHS